MSRAVATDDRRHDDDYPTPTWCVVQLRKFVDLPRPGASILEPSAGAGNIIRTLSLVERVPYQWTAVEVQEDHAQRLDGLGAEMRTRGLPEMHVVCGSFLDVGRRWLDEGRHFDAVVMNPPFTHNMVFLDLCLRLADAVFMYGRVDFPGSRDRNPFMTVRPPDVHMLVPRPRPVGGRSDSGESGWLVWPNTRPRPAGTFRVLPEWPRDQMVGGQELFGGDS